MAKPRSVNFVGLVVQGPGGSIEELVTSDEPDLSHNFELDGADGEYALFGIFPRGSIRRGFRSINPGQVNYFVVTLETPVESQVERTFVQRLGQMLQAKQLRLMLWKDGQNAMIGLINQAGREAGLQPLLQPGEIEDFQTLPDPGEGQAQLSRGMSVSKPSGHWTVVINTPAELSGSKAGSYLKQILAAFEEAAAPMLEQGLLAFYRIVNRMTNKAIKEEWSKQGRQRATEEDQAHQAAINYLYHLAETSFNDYPSLKAEFIKAIQRKYMTRPNSEPVKKVNLENDSTVKALMKEESPVFRLAIQALHKMDLDDFKRLDQVMQVFRQKSTEAEGHASFNFLMAFGSLHDASHMEQIEEDIERLANPDDVGCLLTFGVIRHILDNVRELEEVGCGSVVARVQHAASQGLEAVAMEPSRDALRHLTHDAEDILKLKGVVQFPPHLEEFFQRAVEEKKHPRQLRQPERAVKKPAKATQGKSGESMSYDSVEGRLRLHGLTPIAGGSKYTYWGLAGTPANDGTFIRLAARTVRLVERSKDGRKINDVGITEELYYGKLTLQLVDKLITALKQRSVLGQ